MRKLHEHDPGRLAAGVGRSASAAACWDLPLPAPPRLTGAVLVVAMSSVFLLADWVLQ